MSKKNETRVPLITYDSYNGKRYNIGVHTLVSGEVKADIVLVSIELGGQEHETFVGSRAKAIDYLVCNGLTWDVAEELVDDISAETKTIV